MKKFIIILGTMLAFNAASAMAAYEIGDVDCNGKITATDSAYLAKRANDESFKLPIESEAGESYYYDFDSDGEITLEDARALLETVRNKDLKTIYSEKQLKIDEIGWAYPNTAYWSAANYPDGAEQNYLVEIYKNGEKVKEIQITKNALSENEIYAYADLSELISEDKGGEYTFRVKALGGNSGFYDSSFTPMSNKYIYNDEDDSQERMYISVSDGGAVQVKIFNMAQPVNYGFSLSQDDILKQVSYESAPEFFEGYEYGDMAGSSCCEITTFVPVKSGTVNFKFYCESLDGTAETIKTTAVTVDEKLNVTTE